MNFLAWVRDVIRRKRPQPPVSDGELREAKERLREYEWYVEELARRDEVLRRRSG